MSKIKLTLTYDHVEEVIGYDNEHYNTEYEGSYEQYCNVYPLTLEFDVPSPWRTDFENAPRDFSEILVVVLIDGRRCPETVRWVRELLEWSGAGREYEDHQITHWMEIPKLPEV